ncbi:MAG: iron-sulfur cluster assembly accessory protein [Myxococcales bacterium]|nr:iron-sulfur cluster assembly accessory protein [Myxococcales bacterium]MCB9520132.1 iron-sulfur cluster assembly accessory protein [Myxococcales bacterium]MCB9531247.1 iron-sulfur cluster assembly accessory protein [Myxococcales bacterium]
MALSLTERAAERIREIIRQNGMSADAGVRLGVKSGGCSGLSYVLEVDMPADADRIYDSHGVKVFCDPKSYLYINGTEVDFSSDLLNGGFRFENPNVKRGCGCGTSFSV